MLTTPLCHTLGMNAPIFSVGMGALAGPTLAAAVSNAGACGVLGRVSGAPAAHLRKQIREVRALTDKPFGVNIILATLQAEWIDICLDERVPLMVFFWGDPSPMSRTRTGVASKYSSKWDLSRKHRRQRRPASMESLPRGWRQGDM